MVYRGFPYWGLCEDSFYVATLFAGRLFVGYPLLLLLVQCISNHCALGHLGLGAGDRVGLGYVLSQLLEAKYINIFSDFTLELGLVELFCFLSELNVAEIIWVKLLQGIDQ